MSEEIRIVTYDEMLKELEESKGECHLLLGNGFNNSLSICTDYKSIFEKINEQEPIYTKIQEEIAKKNYDIENLIGKLKNAIKSDNEEINNFLGEYIERKVKFDFMKAASAIVREKIGNIYKQEDKNLHLFFSKFNNYFTLNFDTLLYLLLMKFKKKGQNVPEGFLFGNTFSFTSKVLNLEKQDIYDKIKNDYEEGKLKIEFPTDTREANSTQLTKSQFMTIVKIFYKKSNMEWKGKDIKEVCDKIWEEMRDEKLIIDTNDGFAKDFFEARTDQNVFFLHGSFHIYEDGKKQVRKITQSQNKALYERLENIIDTEGEEIVCVLTSRADEKKAQIDKNPYLSKALKKLTELSGCVFIFGSSLEDNDQHIFDALNKSQVEKIYTSCHPNEKEKVYGKAKKAFPEKKIVLLNYKTISYSSSRDAVQEQEGE